MCPADQATPVLPPRAGRTGFVVLAGAAGALAWRYLRGRAAIERAALRDVSKRLSDIGEVDSLTVLPLVERLVGDSDLRGEPGVCYLLRAGQTSVLFDCGL